MKKLILLLLFLFTLMGAARAKTLIIKVPDEKANILINAFANHFNYQTIIKDENGDSIPNPQSKKEFAVETIRKFIEDVYVAVKAKTADSARVTAIEDARIYLEDSIIISER